MRSHNTTIAAAAAVAGGLLAGLPAAAAAADLQCSASAVRATVLGQAAEPVVAGGDGACAPGRTALSALPAPLSASSASAATDVVDGGALASSALSGFAVGRLPDLGVAVPQAELPAGLDRLAVPLPASAALLGLPSSITVDAAAAAARMLPARGLPDVAMLAADAVTTIASAACEAGRPLLKGLSDVQGLRVLGQAVDATQSGTRSLDVLPAGAVDLSAIDPRDVVLPAGLSLADPVTGPVLRAALLPVLAGLPVVSVPAVGGRVTVTPAAQQSDGGSLAQQAVRVQVDLLGRPVADVTLGLARVGIDLLGCGVPLPAVVPPAALPLQAASAPVAPASRLAVSCAKADLTLVDVAQKKGYVALLGAADQRFVGKRVDVVLTATGRKVTSAVVRPDGFFRARAPLPPAAIRRTNLARYQAVAGREKSLELKLHRRMRLSRLSHRGDEVLIVGKVLGEMPSGEEVVIKRRVSCTKDVVVKRVAPGPDGVWRVRVPAPRGVDAATYRASTEVVSGEREKRFPSFTLPGYVSLGS